MDNKITPEFIAKHAQVLSEGEILRYINQLIKETEERVVKESTELLTEADYEQFYNTAKDYWMAFDMPVKGYVKEIKQCMWQAFESAGITNVHSKRDFLNTTKFMYVQHSVLEKLYEVMMYG